MSSARATRESWRGFGDAWTALNTLVAGIAVWGGAGYGLDLLLGTKPVLLIIGVLVGNFLGIYLMYIRQVAADAEAARRRGRPAATGGDGRAA